MTYRVCPKCTSWRVRGVEVGLFRDRLLNIVNMRLYHCRDCGWQGIAKSKEKRNLIKVLLQPSAWKNILVGFFMLVGIYAVSNMLITMIEKHASAVKPLSAPIQELRVIGNRDSKRYHLPGMKFYLMVEAHHRVEFSSEDEAIKAGYHKAPR